MRQLPSVSKNVISLNQRYLNAFPNSCGEPYNYSERYFSFAAAKGRAYAAGTLCAVVAAAIL
jgi:hypothetical protein